MLNPETYESTEQQEPEPTSEPLSDTHEALSDVKQIEKVGADNNKESKDFPADRITREETEKRTPEMIRLVTQGLGELFELLPKDRDINAHDIVSLIEHTELSMMLPGMRNKFAEEAISKKIFLTRDKADFISQSLETDAIKMLVHLEAMKAGSEAIMARLGEQPGSTALLNEDRAKDVMLEQLHREVENIYNKDNESSERDDLG